MRLSRVRFTVRSMMIAVALLAAAFAAWMEFGQYRWRQHLNTEMTWSRSPAGLFLAKHDFERHAANSLLKVSEVGAPDGDGYYSEHRWCLGRGGELLEETYGGTGGGAGQNYLTAEELAQVQRIISRLPPPNGPYSQGDLLLVSSLSEGSWVTKAYDKAALPPAVKDLVRVLRPRF